MEKIGLMQASKLLDTLTKMKIPCAWEKISNITDQQRRLFWALIYNDKIEQLKLELNKL